MSWERRIATVLRTARNRGDMAPPPRVVSMAEPLTALELAYMRSHATILGSDVRRLLATVDDLQRRLDAQSRDFGMFTQAACSKTKELELRILELEGRLPDDHQSYRGSSVHPALNEVLRRWAAAGPSEEGT